MALVPEVNYLPERIKELRTTIRASREILRVFPINTADDVVAFGHDVAINYKFTFQDGTIDVIISPLSMFTSETSTSSPLIRDSVSHTSYRTQINNHLKQVCTTMAASLPELIVLAAAIETPYLTSTRARISTQSTTPSSIRRAIPGSVDEIATPTITTPVSTSTRPRIHQH